MKQKKQNKKQNTFSKNEQEVIKIALYEYLDNIKFEWATKPNEARKTASELIDKINEFLYH